MRKGLSLTEVLISMGILTLGLLGVAAVFPVGSHYMMQADISDKASAIAQSVMSDAATRGMLDPNSWYVMVPYASPTVYGTLFNADGSGSPSGQKRGTFTRPLSRALAEALTQANATTDKSILARQFGSAFVIDPLGVAQMSAANGATAPAQVQQGPSAVFPAAAYNGFLYNAHFPAWGYNWTNTPWMSWCGGSLTNYSGFEWPIRRVTFRQPSTGWHVMGAMAEHFFRSNDDLSFDFPQRADRPAFASWDTTSSGLPLTRKFTGDYSWIITVVPPTTAARNAIATNPEGYAYDVSVVVFHKRLLPEDADTLYPAVGASSGLYWGTMSRNERYTKANINSAGLNGGELLITDMKDFTDQGGRLVSAFENLRVGHWVMLSGPHPNSSTADPKFVLMWYQVVSVEDARSDMIGYDANYPQKLITVRGAQWPWEPKSGSGEKHLPSNDLSVAICKGAVAVHTKSMRLEGQGSAFGVSTGFGNSGNPSTTPPAWSLH